jgi:hypothetical protein
MAARAEAAEERIAALEDQVKTLQEALRNQGSVVAASVTPSISTETNAVAESGAIVRVSGLQPR